MLAAQSHLPERVLLDGDSVFSEFKGALAEQYVQQELRASGSKRPFFWNSSDSRTEVDFLFEHQGLVIPIEVKAEENLRSKSLKAYNERFSPKYTIRTSMAGMKDEGWMKNIPLYALACL